MNLKGLRIYHHAKTLSFRKQTKGTSLLLNKSDHIKRIPEMLLDIDKFKKLNVKPGKELNLLLNREERYQKIYRGRFR